MTQVLLFLLVSGTLGYHLSSFQWLKPFNDTQKIYQLCESNVMKKVMLYKRNERVIQEHISRYMLCYDDYYNFVNPKYEPLAWLMRSLSFCDVNQIFAYSKQASQYNRDFQTNFLRYSYVMICDAYANLSPAQKYTSMFYNSLFRMLYEINSPDRQIICNRTSQVYSDLYSRCYVPHVAKRQRKIIQRCSSTTAPLLRFTALFQRFSRNCNSFENFVHKQLSTTSSMGLALANDTIFMNLLSSNLYSNIHADSQLPTLVLRTRLLLQHFSLAAVKLWQQIEAYQTCQKSVLERMAHVTDINEKNTEVSNNCCTTSHICELGKTKRFRFLSENAMVGFRVEFVLLGIVCFHTILLAVLLVRTSRSLSTATVLFVLNIMFSNMLFMLSFGFFFLDLFQDSPYGQVNDEHVDKSAELIVAESLQTHLFSSVQFRKYLVQETLYSLSQNGSLIGLIHLLVLVLIVINRSMAGSSVHISKVAVVSLFSSVWVALITTHVMFSAMQFSGIKYLDELFTMLASGRLYVQCNSTTRSGYQEIADHCDKTAVFHTFGAYLLRGHTLFTLFFLVVSIVIFTVTIAYHVKMHRDNDFLHQRVKEHSPHRRRERLFHTLILSIITFFLSVLGQTYIEIAVFMVTDREDVAKLTKWYHYARIAAFVDPVLNPLIVVARTPALRRHLRAQLSSIRSQTSTRVRSLGGSRKVLLVYSLISSIVKLPPTAHKISAALKSENSIQIDRSSHSNGRTPPDGVENLKFAAVQ